MIICQTFTPLIPVTFPLLSWRMQGNLIGIKRESKGDLFCFFVDVCLCQGDRCFDTFAFHLLRRSVVVICIGSNYVPWNYLSKALNPSVLQCVVSVLSCVVKKKECTSCDRVPWNSIASALESAL